MSQQLAVQGIDLSDVLDGFDKVAPSGAGEYFEPGKYIVEIQSCEFKKGHKGVSFIGVCKIVHIFHTEAEGLTVGHSRNIVENLTGQNAAICKGNMKAFLLAGCESLYRQKLDHRAVKAEFAAACGSAAQPLKGVFVICEAVSKEKQAKKGEFITVKNWKMISEAELASFGQGWTLPPNPLARAQAAA